MDFLFNDAVVHRDLYVAVVVTVRSCRSRTASSRTAPADNKVAGLIM